MFLIIFIKNLLLSDVKNMAIEFNKITIMLTYLIKNIESNCSSNPFYL